jgi:UDP-N-acetylglucosamine--N-acetylmuramyl-(pentapeptide) pyrophosphoryl-undecaprenol N-acetylglucosamine transferase
MRILIAGGGTGGHLFPGIALAQECIARTDSHEVRFLGTLHGLESREVPRVGFALDLIEVNALKGKGFFGCIPSLLRVPRAMLQSWKFLKRFHPHVVIGVGGYASGPGVLAACLMRIPTLILEQNALPGLTNRVLGKFVRKVVVAFPEALTYFSHNKAILMGNPVRKSLVDNFLRTTKSSDKSSHDTHLLVFGGSQGARVLNQVLPETLFLLKERIHNLHTMHQAGYQESDVVQKHYSEFGLEHVVKVVPFIDNMAEVYKWADLVICRSGASSIAELSVCCKPAILVPFARAASNHQEVNARALVEKGAAVMIRECELEPKTLAREILAIISNIERLDGMGKAAQSVGRPESARKICDLCLELGSGSRWFRKECV